MGPFKVCFVFAFFASLVLIAAAAEDEGGVSENPLSDSIDGVATRGAPPPVGYVYTVERFYRTYEDGTIEFKLVLSNGLAQFQKITNKEVNGKTIQVYEGYYSTPQPDGTYSTTFYIADENGYRRTRQERDTKPPVLPPYVPHVPKGQA